MILSTLGQPCSYKKKKIEGRKFKAELKKKRRKGRNKERCHRHQKRKDEEQKGTRKNIEEEDANVYKNGARRRKRERPKEKKQTLMYVSYFKRHKTMPLVYTFKLKKKVILGK